MQLVTQLGKPIFLHGQDSAHNSFYSENDRVN